jgi:N-acetylglucosaminyl-diphospho-decaprenol L-rhamnosyltransferase
VSKTPTLAVQVVNYGTRSYLEKCLGTVVADLDRSEIPYEINLLDNASGEDLDDLAQTLPACRAYSASRNLGFGAGHNLLAAKTPAPYLLILNPDVEFVSPATAERLLAIVAGEDRVKAAGPKLVTATGEPQPWDHGRLHGLRAQISVRAGHAYWRPTDVRQEVAWVSGAVLLVEHAAFTALGGFDEKLFLYKEDEDLCLRLRRANGRVVYEPAVVARHHGSVAADRRAALADASRYFFAKHFPNRRTRRVFDIAHNWLAHLRL